MWVIFLLALILVSLGCILCQELGNNAHLLAYYANNIGDYKKKSWKKVKQELP